MKISQADLLQLAGNPDLLASEACRRSLFRFVQEFWYEIIPDDPIWNWHIPYLCQELEAITDRVLMRKPKLYDLVINIPPGTTKTTICSVMWPAWSWIRRVPGKHAKSLPPRTGAYLRFICGSYAQDITLKNSNASRDILRSDKYRRFFPEIEIRRDTDAKSDFSNTRRGSRFSTSVGSRVMGTHGHIIIIDDPIDPEQALSDADRIRANEFMDNVQTRKTDKKVTPLVLIMQRLHDDDPTAHLKRLSEEEGGGAIRHLKIPGTTDYDIEPPELKENYKDGLLDPIRLDLPVLQEMRVRLGSYKFSGQVGQDPRPREGAMFQKSWFEAVSQLPVPKKEKIGPVRGWDLAGTTEKEARRRGRSAVLKQARTVGVRVSMIDGMIYVEDLAADLVKGEQMRALMRGTASQDPEGTVQDVPQDPGQAGKDQVTDLVKNLQGFVVRYSTESGDKVLRADPLSSQAEAGNVRILKAPWNHDFLEEVSVFPVGRKDIVDAFVRAYNRLLLLQKLGNVGGDEIGSPTGISNPHQMRPEG